MAGPWGRAAPCLLWMLLLWSAGRGGQAQRAGCKTIHYDLVFLLDTSSSVGKEDFEKVRQWVANLVDTFEVGPDRTRVGVVRYSDRPSLAFELGRFSSREAVKAAARQLAYHGGNTNTGDALRFLTRHSFSPQAGGRPGDRAFKQVVILLTDGRSQDLVLDAAAAAHRAGIRVFAVGVGEALKEELEEMASEPKSAHVFHVSDFDAIDKIRGQLRRRLCEKFSQQSSESLLAGDLAHSRGSEVSGLAVGCWRGTVCPGACAITRAAFLQSTLHHAAVGFSGPGDEDRGLAVCTCTPAWRPGPVDATADAHGPSLWAPGEATAVHCLYGLKPLSGEAPKPDEVLGLCRVPSSPSPIPASVPASPFSFLWGTSYVLCPSVRVEGDRFQHASGGSKEITGFDLMDLFSVWDVVGRRESRAQSAYVRLGAFPVVQRTEAARPGVVRLGIVGVQGPVQGRVLGVGRPCQLPWDVFPRGLPDEYALATTLRLRRASRGEDWYLWQVFDQYGIPQGPRAGWGAQGAPGTPQACSGEAASLAGLAGPSSPWAGHQRARAGGSCPVPALRLRRASEGLVGLLFSWRGAKALSFRAVLVKQAVEPRGLGQPGATRPAFRENGQCSDAALHGTLLEALDSHTGPELPHSASRSRVTAGPVAAATVCARAAPCEAACSWLCCPLPGDFSAGQAHGAHTFPGPVAERPASSVWAEERGNGSSPEAADWGAARAPRFPSIGGASVDEDHLLTLGETQERRPCPGSWACSSRVHSGLKP
ncbi:Collagen alpha-1(XXII) chain [Galemys pyrenaicus]|uniref:Collagen alpha-1(XXII) chain n=1 Tax=Galemys pyrenaicus TaxID=202257 RepID=A0A8J6A4T7_GALPY|nr:Collagen alpha-1(XXII) chain [Galemys pyrenaicus]